MTEYALSLGVAAILSAVALLNWNEIRRGRDLDQVFVENEIKTGWLKNFLGNFDYFSKVTMPLAVAGFAIIIGTYRLLDRG